MRQGFFSLAHTLALCLMLTWCAPQDAAAESLPLDQEKNFAMFLDKFGELPTKEQLRYCALPFTFSRQVLYEEEVKGLTIPTLAELEAHIKDWQSFLPDRKKLKADGLVLTSLPLEKGLKPVLLGPPNSEPIIVYSFKQFNKVWRLVDVLQYVDEL